MTGVAEGRGQAANNEFAETRQWLDSALGQVAEVPRSRAADGRCLHRVFHHTDASSLSGLLAGNGGDLPAARGGAPG